VYVLNSNKMCACATQFFSSLHIRCAVLHRKICTCCSVVKVQDRKNERASKMWFYRCDLQRENSRPLLMSTVCKFVLTACRRASGLQSLQLLGQGKTFVFVQICIYSLTSSGV
jgi:hypothetical protein